ncbi:phospholipid scramblase 1-like isoform X2 [Symsagittifera roscoffensis]|uniref:phospholipid scramblase 1-like isoform X2 n=1 Tax=Symsagittifera roscoffensis TaxID=84072 RepID=UPI00307C8579
MTESNNVVSLEVPQKALAPLKNGLNWVGPQQPIVGVPYGLEYLVKLDQVKIERSKEANDSSWDVACKWYVKTVDGDVVFQVFEEPDSRQTNYLTCSRSRSYNLHFMDRNHKEVMIVKKELNSCSDTNKCGCSEASVEAPLGNNIGRMQTDCSLCSPQFSVVNYESDFALVIDGPCYSKNCCCSHKFDIRNEEGQNVGRVVSNYLETKEKDVFTAVDNYTVEIMEELETRQKGALIGTAFLMDILLFHNNS